MHGRTRDLTMPKYQGGKKKKPPLNLHELSLSRKKKKKKKKKRKEKKESCFSTIIWFRHLLKQLVDIATVNRERNKEGAYCQLPELTTVVAGAMTALRRLWQQLGGDWRWRYDSKRENERGESMWSEQGFLSESLLNGNSLTNEKTKSLKRQHRKRQSYGKRHSTSKTLAIL